MSMLQNFLGITSNQPKQKVNVGLAIVSAKVTRYSPLSTENSSNSCENLKIDNENHREEKKNTQELVPVPNIR